MKYLFYLISLLALLSCSNPPKEERAKSMLEVVLKDDLAAILLGVDSSAVLDKPHYTITHWKQFEKGTFRYKAEVDFLFLKSINKKISRKYRYSAPHQKWDRYFNEYETVK